MNSDSSSSIPVLFSAWPVFLKVFAAFAYGALMVAAMPPWCVWPALFIGLSLFYILLSATEKKWQTFLLGWTFGFGYFVFGLSWVGNALLIDGSPYKMFWPLAVTALPALLALFPASACYLVKRITRLDQLGGLLLFTAVFTGFEWLRGHIFTGFPWNLFGYTWSQTLPMAQLASIGGVYWLTLLTFLWAVAPGFLWLWPQKRWLKTFMLVFMALLMGVGYLYGQNRLHLFPTEIRDDIAIKLVQPNISQADKWDPEKMDDNIRKLLALSEAENLNRNFTTLIVWPETALTDFVLNDVTVRNAIKSMLAGYEMPVYLLSGVMRFDEADSDRRTYYNSVVLFDERLNVMASYDKSHLVPFGEYIPFQKWIPLTPVVNFTGFQAGNGPKTIEIPVISNRPEDNGEPTESVFISPLICYEIIFPGAVIPDADKTDFIVNVTNDAWYGDSAGPRQHLVMAQFRAIEEGIPVVRSANTGISSVIDPVGRIAYRQALLTEAGHSVALPLKLGVTKLYSSKKNGLFFLSLITMVLASTISLLYSNTKASRKSDQSNTA